MIHCQAQTLRRRRHRGVGMYPGAFAYHRATSYPEAISQLSELGEDAKFLAGGQSLIPLMKLRLSTPRHLVDLNFIPDTSYIHSNGALAHRRHDASLADCRLVRCRRAAHSSRLRCRYRRSAGSPHGNHRRLHRRGRSYWRLGARSAGHGSDGEDALGPAASAASTSLTSSLTPTRLRCSRANS